jgi:hypothetical protein
MNSNNQNDANAANTPGSPNLARRFFFKSAGAGVGAAYLGSIGGAVFAAEVRPLLDPVRAACNRLAPLGWRDMLLAATGGALDITAPDLKRELLKPLTGIVRGFPGFGDFANAGGHAVRPGQPDLSLLYHAFASATVVARPDGRSLDGFPTLAEIDALENFIYGVEAPTLESLRQRANGQPLGLAVFALHYRNTPDSVHGRHAELCFARTGTARVGSIEPLYDERKRLFVNVDEARPFELRVTPQRFVAYLAVRMKGGQPGEVKGFGPQDPLTGDEKLDFWVPLHKLFGGAECISGMHLDVSLSRSLQNEELAQFHKYLDREGHHNNWRGKDLEQFPFTIRDDKIATLATRADYGPGVLLPRAAPMTSVAQYQGQPVTFPVYPSTPGDLQMSSLFVIPGVEPPLQPAYQDDAEQNAQRQAPEYTNVRHRVNPDGTLDNLNRYPEMSDIIHKGGYQALHFIDFTGDGWIEVQCPQLTPKVDYHLAAYCMVGLPDFFPAMTQRDLMLWTENGLPTNVSDALWVIKPLALSQTRIAANITLPIGFSIKDVTITAIVSQQSGVLQSQVQTPNGPLVRGKVGLPDGSPGLFDPGWDTSQGIHFSVIGEKDNPALKLEKFLAGYSLGSPFIEDAKLCAALGSYWPGVAPDATRTFQPGKKISGKPYPWPTVVPLTDQEIGSAPLPNGKRMPWDGVEGPIFRNVGGKPMALYTNIFRTDYIDLIGTMTAALTAKIDGAEYKARVLAMETVYWNLGIQGRTSELSCADNSGGASAASSKLPSRQIDVNRVLRCKAAWAVLSFSILKDTDPAPALRAAEQATGKKLKGDRIFAFHVFRWNPEHPEMQDPADFNKVLVEMLEQAFFYVDDKQVLMQRGTGTWKSGVSLPT